MDGHKVSTLLSALPEEERQGLVALSPTLAEILSPGNPSERTKTTEAKERTWVRSK